MNIGLLVFIQFSRGLSSELFGNCFGGILFSNVGIVGNCHIPWVLNDAACLCLL